MTEINNITKTLKDAKEVAIVLPEEHSMDAFCAAMALSEIVIKSGNSASIFSSSKSLWTLPFIKSSPAVKNSLSKGDQLVIKISSKNADPKEIKYEKDSTGLNIFVTAGSGRFKESDVSILPSDASFNLVVTLGASNFEAIGYLYAKNTKLFFETPLINIDINPSNEYFSKVNLVIPTSSSLCEIVYDIVKELAVEMNDTITTSLLAGIISETESFRDPRTTPAALQKSSELIVGGARQQDIVQHLFKTKSLQQLQLWGRALARLNEFADKRTITAVLTKNDMDKTGNNQELLPAVLKDLIEMVTGYSLVILIVEELQVLVAGLPHEKISDLATTLLGNELHLKPINVVGQYEYVSFELKTPLVELQEKINSIISKR